MPNRYGHTRMIELRKFQQEFIRGALDPAVDCAALSLPRGNGKSSLAAHLVARILDPADELFRPGTESVLLAASIKQARIVYRMARDLLEVKGDYAFLDATNRVGIKHPSTNTRLDVISSSGKSAMGLVGCPWAIADEPGSWEVNAGGLMWDALTGAQGKPGSPLKILLIGTLAPGGVDGSWWRELVDRGSHGTKYVMAIQGDPEKWDRWSEIRRCNPLTAVSAAFRKKLLEERNEARADSRLKARFLSYRLNVPSGDESSMLLTVEDWQRTLARPVRIVTAVCLSWALISAPGVRSRQLRPFGRAVAWSASRSVPASRRLRTRKSGIGYRRAPIERSSSGAF